MIDDPMNRTHAKRGTDLPQSRLTDDDVRTIRALIEHRADLLRQAKQLTNKRIADKYGVHFRTIDRISSGETWGHVD